MTIDRRDSNGNYCMENCHWIDSKRQQANKASNKLLTLNGETLCIADWSRKTGINYETIRGRLQRGWNLERALS